MKDKIFSTFRALRHKNYSLFFIGQCISLVGTWIQQIATSWLVYRLTGSALLMGLIVFTGSIPSLIISPFAGVFIDRINKYKGLLIIQTIFMLEIFILAMLALSGSIQVWHIIILSIIIGITAAIDMPLRQSFVVQLVDDPNDLSNAISLNSSMFNLARLIGPAIAGVLIAAVGEGVCFLIDSLSYIAVLSALFMMKIKYIPNRKTSDKKLLDEFKEGIKYTANFPIIKNSLLYLALASFIGMSYPVLMPIFAKEVLGGNAQTLGWLMSASGCGALVGALHLASQKRISRFKIFILIASILFGLAMCGLTFTRNLHISLVFLFIIGFGMVTIMASCNTIIQHYVDESKRGRVMSLYAMAFIGTAPIGSLVEGAIAEKIGLPLTFMINGLSMLIAALIFRSKLDTFNPKNKKLSFNKSIIDEKVTPSFPIE